MWIKRKTVEMSSAGENMDRIEREILIDAPIERSGRW